MTLSNTDNEATLLRSIKDGNKPAMHTLYCRYVRYLTAICTRYINDEEDVRDVMQDSFVKIFSTITAFSYRGDGSLKAWMAKIVLNETLKFIQKNCRLNFIELKNNEIDISSPPDDEPPTESLPSSVIFEMIRSLPDGYRTIFNLHIIEEKSHKEIAQLLGITESTSASQLHRAKALLANKIKNYKSTEARR